MYIGFSFALRISLNDDISVGEIKILNTIMNISTTNLISFRDLTKSTKKQ